MSWRMSGYGVLWHMATKPSQRDVKMHGAFVDIRFCMEHIELYNFMQKLYKAIIKMVCLKTKQKNKSLLIVLSN